MRLDLTDLDQPLAALSRSPGRVSILPAMPSDAALLTRDLALDLGRARSCRCRWARRPMPLAS